MIFLLLSVKVNVSVLIQFPHFALITTCHHALVLLLHPWTLFRCLNKVSVALAHLGWRSAMIEEIDALTDNGTWDLVRLPARKKAIGCR